MIKSYEKIGIRNLRYNMAIFATSTIVSISSIAAIAYASQPAIDFEAMVVEAEAIPLKTNIQSTNVIEEAAKLSEEKVYSGMKIDNELEDEIKRLCELYGIPYQIVLTIGERESGGNWNNNGVVSPSNDYGTFQINECNLSYIEENLGYTKNDILYNQSKNAEACIYLLKDIINRNDVTSIEDVFGMYNGWVGWENKPLAATYSEACCQIVNNYFPDFEYNNQRKY